MLEVVNNPEQSLIDFFEEKIDRFNWDNWEVNERKPLVVQLKNDQGEPIAGASARTFGDWLLLDTLWVDDSLRGKKIGSQILNRIEDIAKERGCSHSLLDTLNFQAMPFYKKHGYKVEWVQENYPKTGCKYFMTKKL